MTSVGPLEPVPAVQPWRALQLDVGVPAQLAPAYTDSAATPPEHAVIVECPPNETHVPESVVCALTNTLLAVRGQNELFTGGAHEYCA